MSQAGNFGQSPLFALLAFLVAVTPLAAAQRSSSAGHAVAPSGHAIRPNNRPNGGHAFGRNQRPAASRRSPYIPPYTSLPFPFFGDAFDPDDIYSTGYPVASQPPPYLLQAVQDMARPAADSMGPGMSPFDNRQSPSTQPLMIELQNGRYVRVSNTAASADVREPTPAPAIAAQSLPRDLPSAVLIFRDGHTEEVHDYAIADGILYARGDYYTDGYWNKKIDLSALNVTETLQANNERNVKFVLPSSPNEVITRP